ASTARDSHTSGTGGAATPQSLPAHHFHGPPTTVVANVSASSAHRKPAAWSKNGRAPVFTAVSDRCTYSAPNAPSAARYISQARQWLSTRPKWIAVSASSTSGTAKPLTKPNSPNSTHSAAAAAWRSRPV